MSHPQHLGHGIYHVDAHYIQQGVASLYCIIDNDEVAIVETGTAHSLPYLQQLLAELSISAEQIKYVIPTHVHLDHAGGVGVMMQTFPQAKLVIHPRGARHMIDPTRLVAATIAVYGEDAFNELYGELPPVDAERVISAEHLSRFSLGNRDLTIIDTPGHAYHHFCVVDENSEGVFSGDTFGLSYPNLLQQGKRLVIPTTTPSHFNPVAMHQSIDLIMSYQPQRIYLTHFNMLPNPAEVVDQYRQTLDQFVELTEAVQPEGESAIAAMIKGMSELLKSSFGFNDEIITGQLANDIRLNSQGLSYWYQHRE